MTHLAFIRSLLRLFDRKERFFLAALISMMTLGAAFETVSIGLIIPVISVIGNPDLVTQNKVLAYLYNLVNASSTEQFLVYLCITLVVVYVVKNGYLGALAFIQASFIFRKQAQLSSKLLSHYLRQPYPFYLQHNSSELQYNTLGAVNNVTGGIITPLLLVVSEALVLAFILALLFVVKPWITTGAVVAALVLGWGLQKAFKRGLTQLGQLSNRASKSMVKSVNQAFGSIKEVRILGRESYFVRAFDVDGVAYVKSAGRFSALGAMPRLLTETIVVSGLLIAVVILLKYDWAFQEGFPVLALVGVAALRIMPSFNRITGGLNSIRFNRAAVGSLDFAALEASNAAGDMQESEVANPPEFRYLEFRDVHFQYDRAPAESLSEVSLKVSRGEHVGIVGSTGAGKSTLINLLLGLLDPTKGAIYIGAEPLPAVRTRWQRMIGYVPQSIYLLDDTVRRNVALGISDPEIDDADVWAALEASRVAEKFRALPTGLDTVVGENGVRLSGGERQRLGIARALFTKPQVMIFDEATSSLDRQTESEITETIHALGDQRTVIVVTHRISTTRPCDRIYLVDRGRVVQAGTYPQLLEANAWFRGAAGEPSLQHAAQRV